MNEVVTRFAPSPTGHLHLGSARTALFCYLFSRHHAGKFILRFEDTDQRRSQANYMASILAALKWMGLNWDGEPIHQSSRAPLYAKTIERLLTEDKAYRCLRTPTELEELRRKQRARGEKPKYDGYYRDKNIGAAAKHFVVRFKNPLTGTTAYHDLVRGAVRMSNEELDDLVIARADGSPTYNLCAVVDDIAMGITHILRGDDHIVNSCRQLNIYAALGAKPPRFAHLPMIINDKGERLSKRDGAKDVLDYKEAGVLPAALCSYLARLGWSHGEQEIFSPRELIQLFDVRKIHLSPAGFDEKKLHWVNQYFIRNTAAESLATPVAEIRMAQGMPLAEQPRLADIIAVHKERCSDLRDLAQAISFYYTPPQSYEQTSYAQHIGADTPAHLSALRRQLDRCPEWSAAAIKEAIETSAQILGLGFPQIAMPFRLALCGCGSSPAIPQVAALLGQEETQARLTALLRFIQQDSA